MKRSLRILVAHNVSRIRTGGMSRIMGFIHDQIQNTAGHSIDYACSDDLQRSLNGRLARFTFPIFVFNLAWKAARAGNPYDIINIHEPHGTIVTKWKSSAGNPAVVVTTHGVERRAWELGMEELRLGRSGPGLKTRLLYPATSLWQSKTSLRNADHIFCLSSEDQHYMTMFFKIPPKKILRIFPGAGEVYATVSRDRNYHRAARILFAGTWRKNKGIEDVVPAFCALAQKDPGFTLTVLGSGISEFALKTAFPEPVRHRVYHAQTSTELENAEVFATHDLFLLPSLFEGTPLTLIEAMMSGLPIVTTETCGMKDVIRNEKNGLLIPIRSPEAIVSSITRLLEDPGLRCSLGTTAQREAREKFTWERTASDVLMLYEELRN